MRAILFKNKADVEQERIDKENFIKDIFKQERKVRKRKLYVEEKKEAP